MARYLTGRVINLSHAFVDDETPLTPAAVAVTLTSVSTGLSVFTGAASVGDINWTIAVPSLPVGLYAVTWDGGAIAVDTTYFEVTGGQMFTIAEARASDPELMDKTEFPAAEIAHYREVIEWEFEAIADRSFVTRQRVLHLDAPGCDAVWLGLMDVVSLDAISGPSGVLVASDYRVDAMGVLSGLEGITEGAPLRVVVTYGWNQVPMDVKRVALIRLRYFLASENSGIPDRATNFVSTAGGQFTLATAGRHGYKTGLPEVDGCLKEYGLSIVRNLLAGFQ